MLYQKTSTFYLFASKLYLKSPALNLFRGMSEQIVPASFLLGGRGYLKGPALNLLGGGEYL
jgi:hypothetical protein